jgi:small subunit ribosomal protein S30e
VPRLWEIIVVFGKNCTVGAPSALESGNGAVVLIVKQSWEKVRRPSTLLDISDAYAFFLRLVHGSLARAGKVKASTPKVEPQEKKKIPKGRAKKRILYNRRYVPSSTIMFILLTPVL